MALRAPLLPWSPPAPAAPAGRPLVVLPRLAAPKQVSRWTGGKALCPLAFLLGLRKALRTARTAAAAVEAPRAVCQFGNMDYHGTLAEYLRFMQSLPAGYRATPIQNRVMAPIVDGESVAIMSPTGTGKTLAFLLPLWERYIERAFFKGSGPSILIISPSEDLQKQIGKVLRQLAGPRGETSVLILKRNLDISMRVPTADAIVATPGLLLEQLDITQTVELWDKGFYGIHAIVVDEVDAMMQHAGARNSQLSEVLDYIRAVRTSLGEYVPPQLVMASASIDGMTIELMEKQVGVEVAAMRGMVDNLGTRMAYNEEENEHITSRPWLWPEGLKHYVLPLGKLKYSEAGTITAKHMDIVHQALLSLNPNKCLVVLSERRAINERAGSVGKLQKRLRQLLRGSRWVCGTATAAVEDMGNNDMPPYQVIIGRNETIRGLDIPGVDAVVVIGEIATPRDYMHVAGRCARVQPETGKSIGGSVVVITSLINGRTLSKWSKELGFRFKNMVLKPLPPQPREE